MTQDEIIKDCYCNPFMIGVVLMIDWTIFVVQQMIIASSQLHGKENMDA